MPNVAKYNAFDEIEKGLGEFFHTPIILKENMCLRARCHLTFYDVFIALTGERLHQHYVVIQEKKIRA